MCPGARSQVSSGTRGGELPAVAFARHQRAEHATSRLLSTYNQVDCQWGATTAPPGGHFSRTLTVITPGLTHRTHSGIPVIKNVDKPQELEVIVGDTLRKTILLVEDEALIAMTEATALRAKGYTVHHVRSGEQAIEAIIAENPPVDLVLMDINLGRGIDGTEAARQILDIRELPVVFLSSCTDAETVERAATITSYGYVVKNLGIVALDATIRVAFRLFDARLTRKQAEVAREELLERMALMPCHVLFQFYVAEGRLSCQLYQRSADVFLGVPFNIASYALLTCMMAQVCGLEPGDFVHTLGDAHLYSNHLDQARLQLGREPYPLPELWLNPERTDVFGFEFEDIEIRGYQSHPHIKAEVSV